MWSRPSAARARAPRSHHARGVSCNDAAAELGLKTWQPRRVSARGFMAAPWLRFIAQECGSVTRDVSTSEALSRVLPVRAGWARERSLNAFVSVGGRVGVMTGSTTYRLYELGSERLLLGRGLKTTF